MTVASEIAHTLGRRSGSRAPITVRTPLTPDRIKQYEVYRKADRAGFDGLLGFLTSHDFCLDPARSRLSVSLPTLDKLSWRPDVRDLACNTDGGLTIGALSVVHHAMHGLVAHRYGAELRGRPYLSLLSESLASCLQVHFSLCMQRSLPAEMHVGVSAIELYRRMAGMLGVDAEALIAGAATGPFEAFKRAVRGMMTVYRTIIEFDRRVASGDPTACAAELDLALRTMPEFTFIRTFDYGNNVLYTKVYCGLDSSESDARDVADCLALLEAANSLSDLVVALSEQAHHAAPSEAGDEKDEVGP